MWQISFCCFSAADVADQFLLFQRSGCGRSVFAVSVQRMWQISFCCFSAADVADQFLLFQRSRCGRSVFAVSAQWMWQISFCCFSAADVADQFLLFQRRGCGRSVRFVHTWFLSCVRAADAAAAWTRFPLKLYFPFYSPCNKVAYKGLQVHALILFTQTHDHTSCMHTLPPPRPIPVHHLASIFSLLVLL